jgi:hypothetical protein
MHKNWFSHNRKIYLILILGWLVLNLIQAWVTQLHYDEAYYWVYSQKLDWGYFDHPPMVALLVKLGYSIFHNELGVRLLFVFMGTATLSMILYLIKEAEKLSLIIIFLFSITLLHVHVCGFIAIPDTPLVFFATLFFVAYREFLKNDSYKLAIAIGVIASAMLYSKYHGILILLFTVLSNIKILKNKKTWVAIFIIIVLMLPHLWWQIQNQFPTMNFQLMGRLRGFALREPVNYILGQLALPGLITGIILIYLAIVYKPIDHFEKSLKWNIFGFYLFFLLFSFKMGIEAHWTAAIIPPLAFISFKAIRDKELLLKWFKPLAIIGIVLLFSMRIIIANDSIANFLKVDTKFNNWRQFALKTKELANGREVIFISSYKRPAEYSFYTGQMTPSVAKIGYRYSYYDFNHFDDSLAQKTVILIEGGAEKSDSFYIGDGSDKLKYYTLSNYSPYHQFKLDYIANKLIVKQTDTVVIPVLLTNVSNNVIHLNKNLQMLPKICCEMNGPIYSQWFNNLDNYTENKIIYPNDSIRMIMKLPMHSKPGDYVVRFHVAFGDGLRGSSGKAIKIKVE